MRDVLDQSKEGYRPSLLYGLPFRCLAFYAEASLVVIFYGLSRDCYKVVDTSINLISSASVMSRVLCDGKTSTS